MKLNEADAGCFKNAYALAMRRGRAQALGIRTIDDLAAQARNLV